MVSVIATAGRPGSSPYSLRSHVGHTDHVAETRRRRGEDPHVAVHHAALQHLDQHFPVVRVEKRNTPESFGPKWTTLLLSARCQSAATACRESRRRRVCASAISGAGGLGRFDQEGQRRRRLSRAVRNHQRDLVEPRCRTGVCDGPAPRLPAVTEVPTPCGHGAGARVLERQRSAGAGAAELGRALRVHGDRGPRRPGRGNWWRIVIVVVRIGIGISGWWRRRTAAAADRLSSTASPSWSSASSVAVT